MRSNRLRTPRFALAKALILAVSTAPLPLAWLAASGDDGSRDPLLYGPSPEMQLTMQESFPLQQVAHWIEIEPADLVDGVAQAVREGAESFELFRELPGDAARETVLDEIPFGAEILKAAVAHDLDPFLVASVVEVESTFRTGVASHKGAVGLMQLLPSTAGIPAFLLLNPQTNLDAGSAYLKKMLERFDGDLELALAAYNAGPTNVRRHGGVPPFRETQNYVHKVLSLYVDHHRSAWHHSGFADLVPLARKA